MLGVAACDATDCGKGAASLRARGSKFASGFDTIPTETDRLCTVACGLGAPVFKFAAIASVLSSERVIVLIFLVVVEIAGVGGRLLLPLVVTPMTDLSAKGESFWKGVVVEGCGDAGLTTSPKSSEFTRGLFSSVSSSSPRSFFRRALSFRSAVSRRVFSSTAFRSLSLSWASNCLFRSFMCFISLCSCLMVLSASVTSSFI